MKKSNWCKITSVLLAIALLCTFLGACGDDDFDVPQPPDPQPTDAPTLRVLIDLSLEGSTSAICRDIKSLIEQYAEGCGEKYQVTVEALPTISEPDVRNPTLTGLHMELMGDGPDLFILRNFSSNSGPYTDVKNFFPFPTSAMRQRLLLPLDDYIKDDPNWENLQPAVMEAGKLNGSQQIVPLSYRITTSLLDVDKYDLTVKTPMTWEQMLDSGDPVLRRAACGLPDSNAEILGVLADYQEEELRFTEEELQEVIRRLRRELADLGSFDVMEAGFDPLSVSVSPLNDSFFYASSEDNFWMIPSYNREGGVTARVGVYAAVNRGTKYPDECYEVLKALTSEGAQRSESLTTLGLPVYMDMGQETSPAATDWYLDDWDYQQLKTLQGQINAVEFTTPLTDELTTLFQECLQMEDQGEVEQTVHDAYITMKMMLAES